VAPPKNKIMRSYRAPCIGSWRLGDGLRDAHQTDRRHARCVTDSRLVKRSNSVELPAAGNSPIFQYFPVKKPSKRPKSSLGEFFKKKIIIAKTQSAVWTDNSRSRRWCCSFCAVLSSVSFIVCTLRSPPPPAFTRLICIRNGGHLGQRHVATQIGEELKSGRVYLAADRAQRLPNCCPT